MNTEHTEPVNSLDQTIETNQSVQDVNQNLNLDLDPEIAAFNAFERALRAFAQRLDDQDKGHRK